jgi:hypothetical protein
VAIQSYEIVEDADVGSYQSLEIRHLNENEGTENNKKSLEGETMFHWRKEEPASSWFDIMLHSCISF